MRHFFANNFYTFYTTFLKREQSRGIAVVASTPTVHRTVVSEVDTFCVFNDSSSDVELPVGMATTEPFQSFIGLTSITTR